MKILVTGASGMLGTDLCGCLVTGNRVIGVDINYPAVEHGPASVFFECDITDPDSVGRIFRDTSPDIVVHAAAWTDVDGCENDPEKAERINVKGTEIVARSAARVKAPIVFISTDFVFNGEKGRAYTEDDWPDPINVYGKTKFRAEEAVKKTSGGYAIVRTSWLYGRHGRNFVDTMIEKAGKEKEIRVVDDQVGTPTYTRDLAQALEKLISPGDIPEEGVFHVTNSGQCSWYEFAKKILELKGMGDVRVMPIKSGELGRPARRPAFSVLDNTRFSELMGSTARSWQEAICEYING